MPRRTRRRNQHGGVRLSGPNKDLLQAAKSGDTDAVRAALAAGATLTGNALEEAAINGRDGPMAALIVFNNEHRIRNDYPYLLETSARYGHLSIVQMLQRAMDHEDFVQYSSAALTESIKHPEVFDYLVANGAIITSLTYKKLSPDFSVNDTIRSLITRGARFSSSILNAQVKNPALSEDIKYLIEHGRFCNYKCKSYSINLMDIAEIAAKHNNTAVLR